MSGPSNTGSLRLTPKNRFTPMQTAGKSIPEDSDLSLLLKTVIGTTTNSANAFDSVHESRSFAVCAGSVVVLCQLDEKLNVTQRVFRARPDVWPVNAVPSFYNSSAAQGVPDPRNRLASSPRDGGHGKAPGVFTMGSSSAETAGRSKANKRTRDVTCVSLSPGGKLLAVGETGYSPRILIFSTAPDAQLDVPLSSITEHSFGVRACAFSPDSRWLCSLGNVHDGFVYLWSINPNSGSCKLQFSNKVTSFVHNMAWMGSSVITVGTRHVKVWRLERTMPASPFKKRSEIESHIDGAHGSPLPRTFSGRNCLLGSLLDATFTCVVAISDCKAIICTDKGDVCLLDDTGRNQGLARIAKTGSSILCITVDNINRCLWMGGTMGKLWVLALNIVTSIAVASDHPVSLVGPGSLFESSSSQIADILAVGSVLGHIVTVDSGRSIGIGYVRNIDGRNTVDTGTRMLAHDSSVLGVSTLHQPNSHEADFFTWSVLGTVIFWHLDGTCKGKLQVTIDQADDAEEGCLNELRVVRASEFDDFLVSGDKMGTLRLIDRTGRNITALRAHNGDIHDIALTRRDVNDALVVSCGRDRTLQLFRKTGDNLTIQQTLDDHTASVCNVMFLENGSTLLSTSSDRTVIVRTLATGLAQKVAFIATRVITLKATPVACSALPESNVLVISTLDRQIHKFDLSTGRLLQSFKALDCTSSDSLVISSLSIQKFEKYSGPALVLMGVSSTDKSISVYEYDNGSVLVRDYGQMVVTDAAFLRKRSGSGDTEGFLISTGSDGTIMIWDLTVRSRILAGPYEIVKGESTTELLKSRTSALSNPLRRILSRSEIQDFQKRLETDGDPQTPSRSHPPTQIRKKTSRYTLANTRKVTNTAVSASARQSPSLSSATEVFNHKLSQHHSSTPPSPQTTAGSIKSRRSSLDGRHRRKSTSNLMDLNLAAEQICKSLREYRRKINLSSVILKRDIAEELAHELKLTIGAISQSTTKLGPENETIPGDLLDAYLVTMIDERLAVLNKPGDSADATGGAKISTLSPKTLGDGCMS